MTGAIATHTLFPQTQNIRSTQPIESGIQFTTTTGSQWRISVTKAPILNAEQMDQLTSSKNLQVPYPEMFFGFNKLTMSNEATSGVVIDFSAVDALQCVEFGSTEAMDSVKVAFSKEWTEKSEKLHGKIKQIAKPYDWTYTPKKYSGSVKGPQQFTTTESKIDVEMLKRNDPILWYDEVVLYEDELGDNGSCTLTARVRVMPTCFLILLRYFLRVDGVLFRVHDTRLFHAFHSTTVIRETSTRECSYDRVLGKVPGGAGVFSGGANSSGRDLSLLNKGDWVAQGMPDPLYLEGSGKGVADGVTMSVERDELSLVAKK
ncbi:hypothetical protein HDU79_003123 [Rhizoclosmatium sp. JEL0117]|nr:hypothetical protein HDU79_003123 [Rhizoclosmatium sp. JEL0117]